MILLFYDWTNTFSIISASTEREIYYFYSNSCSLQFSRLPKEVVVAIMERFKECVDVALRDVV